MTFLSLKKVGVMLLGSGKIAAVPSTPADTCTASVCPLGPKLVVRMGNVILFNSPKLMSAMEC